MGGEGKEKKSRFVKWREIAKIAKGVLVVIRVSQWAREHDVLNVELGEHYCSESDDRYRGKGANMLDSCVVAPGKNVGSPLHKIGPEPLRVQLAYDTGSVKGDERVAESPNSITTSR